MKNRVMEAPEKVYLEKIYPDNGILPNGLNYNQGINDIEYIRTDAFIEKAADYIANNMRCDGYTLQTKVKFIKDFKNYMKGEQI